MARKRSEMSAYELSALAKKRQSVPDKSGSKTTRGFNVMDPAARKKAFAAKSKPVPLGGVKQGSVPAKNTGGAEKASYGGWSVPKKVTPSKKTAGGVAKRATQGRRGNRG
jgi:hypothetical protein